MTEPVWHIDRPHHERLQCGRRRGGSHVLGEEEYDHAIEHGYHVCQRCVKLWRARLTERGFLFHSRFAARALPEVIWVDEGREPIVGPFCVHCGNPSYVHGPGARCRNHRIHPLLPLGDLPRPGSGFTEAVTR